MIECNIFDIASYQYVKCTSFCDGPGIKLTVMSTSISSSYQIFGFDFRNRSQKHIVVLP